MAAKPPPYTTLQEGQPDYPQQQEDGYPLQTQPHQQQARYLSEQTRYPPPEELNHPPQQASYPPQRAINRTQQARYPPQPANSPPEQVPNRQRQPSIMNTACLTDGWKSVTTVCQHCEVIIDTDVRYVPGLVACLCCLFCAWRRCPLCNRDYLDVVHSCPNCKMEIGVYERSC